MSRGRCTYTGDCESDRCERCVYFDDRTPTGLVTVEKCKSYIASCGWEFMYYNRPWYVFKSDGGKSWSGNSEITFTLHELREAFNNGW